MKITTLIAAAAIATVSTAAVADQTTPAGEVVMIEKNAGPAAGLAGIGGLGGLIVIGTFIAVGAAASGNGSN